MKSVASAVVTIFALVAFSSGCSVDPGAKLRFLGQPSAGELAELRDQGVDIVINARPDDEMDWDEAAAVTELGMQYHAVPIERSGSAFDRESIARITAIVDANPDSDIVLHCSSGNRVSAWYAIYLVQQKGLSREEALQQARAAGLTRAALEQRIEAYLDES